MPPVDREVDYIHRKILTLACPHCDAAAMYDGGCLAMTCTAPLCGGWKFCAFCLESFLPSAGGDAHDHVAQCQFNVRHRIFPPDGTDKEKLAFFDGVQRERVKRALLSRVQRLQPAELRDAVKAKLASDYKIVL
jgi:hypothetical protein